MKPLFRVLIVIVLTKYIFINNNLTMSKKRNEKKVAVPEPKDDLDDM